MSIDTLAAELKALLNVLEIPDPSWHQTFLNLWGGLDEAISLAIDEGLYVVSQEAIQKLRPNIAALKQMVIEKIDHSAKSAQNNDLPEAQSSSGSNRTSV